MTQILPNIFAVEVPEDSKKFVIKNGAYTKWLWVDGERHVVLNLKAGIKKLFTTKHCTEEQAETVVEKENGYNAYKEYERDGPWVNEIAINSLQSLLRSHGLSTDKNYLLLKKTS